MRTAAAPDGRIISLHEIEVGNSYEFVSEVEQETLPVAERLRQYTGQQALVLGQEETDAESSNLFKVRFPDGREASAWEEELDGWDKALGQFFPPVGQSGGFAA